MTTPTASPNATATNVLDLFGLHGKVVIITGASSGLGVAFAHACAQAGADLVLAARRTDHLRRTAAQLGSTGAKVLTVRTDVADPDQCHALVDAAVTRFGAVDVLVNNAGIGTAVPATRETPDQFRTVIDVNLLGSYWTAQACAKVMRPGSTIINISSILALTTAGLPQAAYSASKSGLIGLTRDLAQQWGTRKGIRVNALAPGFFATEMTDQYPPDYLASVTERSVLARIGRDEELAATLVWLASAASGYVTGQTIVVDGGVTLT